MKLFLVLFLLAGFEVTSYAMPHLATECKIRHSDSGENLAQKLIARLQRVN